MSTVNLKEIADAILALDAETVAEKVRRALEEGVDPDKIIKDGLSKGLKMVGDKFENGEFFLMHLIAAAEAAKKSMNELLLPEIKKRKISRKVVGRVVIGTVAGDIHNIGKDIVASILFAAGFEVHNLGEDVPVDEFVKKIIELDADILAASALLTVTMPVQREIIEALKKAGIRDKVKVIVGGAPVTREWADEIEADGYAPDAIEAAEVAKKLLRKKV